MARWAVQSRYRRNRRRKGHRGRGRASPFPPLHQYGGYVGYLLRNQRLHHHVAFLRASLCHWDRSGRQLCGRLPHAENGDDRPSDAENRQEIEATLITAGAILEPPKDRWVNGARENAQGVDPGNPASSRGASEKHRGDWKEMGVARIESDHRKGKSRNRPVAAV